MKLISYFRPLLCSFAISVLMSASVPATAKTGFVPAQVARTKQINVAAHPNIAQWVDSTSLQNSKEPTQVLLHFSHVPTLVERSDLETSGITLMDYIPDNSFVAVVSAPANLKFAADNNSNLYGVTSVRPEWKIEAQVNRIMGSQGTLRLLVTICNGVAYSDFSTIVNQLGGQLVASSFDKYHLYRLLLPSNKLRSLAMWYGVKYVSSWTDPQPCDLESRPAVKGNLAVSPQEVGGFGLFGDGVTVGVGDNASGILHADLRDRVIDFNPDGATAHGAHVNGIVGGAANIDPFAAGMAPHVNLVDYLFDLIIPETKTMYTNYNMTVTNNSYGVILGDCNYSGTYDAYSFLLDSIAQQNPNVLHVFAAGNDGQMACTPYTPGFATVAGGYQPAKDNIVVGSFTDYMVEASDESRGPTKDGRLKPEVVAVGLGAYSTVAVDTYRWDAGTSMAAPQVAGGVAILTEQYKNLNGGQQPSACLMKALVMNGALDIGNPGPDFSYGFGSLDVYRSLLMLDSSEYFQADINDGDQQIYYINVPPNTAALKVMINWSDPPASLLAANQLVNDVDLTVTDTSGIIHYPLILDPTPGNENNLAHEGPDHLNNMEQVVINNPAPGAYKVSMSGYHIPLGPQPYALVYDLVPQGVLLTFPIGGETLSNVNSPLDSIRIFWDGVTDSNMFTVKLSTDSGLTWTVLSDTIPPSTKHCDFVAPGINSGNCLVTVSRNGTSQTATSGRFAINTQPVVVADDIQCPGYIGIHWSPVPNATSYQLLTKVGFYMAVVDSVTDTAYTFKNMSLTDRSYVAVAPIINGAPGLRSTALKYTASSGNCGNPVSSGDLMIEKIIGPINGRLNTSSARIVNDTLTLKIRNLYQSDCSNYSISYQINGGSWLSSIPTQPIPADSFAVVKISGLNLADTGTYQLIISVTNLAIVDPNHANDTLASVVLQLPNDTISFIQPFTDSFESISVITLTHDSVGISPNGHWDFSNTNDTGRFRTFISDEVTISGQRSISMDDYLCSSSGSYNGFVGTFNLSNLDTSRNELRMDFDYVLSGIPLSQDGNLVNFRGTDTTGWTGIYNYDLTGYPGFPIHVNSLSLTDALRAGHKNFSSSCQIMFGQHDTSLIAGVNYGNGMTLDNFRLYTVSNDVALLKVISPNPYNCGLTGGVPVTVQIHNGVNHTLYNVALGYQADGGGYFTGIIDSIKAKDSIYYTFPTMLTISPGLTHSLNTWVAEAGDTYSGNDSINGYVFRNSAIVSSYPYLENFENGDGGYFADGYRNDWQYGVPASPKIHKAASGSHAWKTNLSGNYNDLEQAYLYSPCFDISALSNPMLSFSAALDVENCGSSLCDQAYVEYSFDGLGWVKLGATGQGTNWYDSTFDIWNTEGFTRWHVASIRLPKPPVTNSLHLRFVLKSDPGTNFEGFAVDDVHIFDLGDSILGVNSPRTATIAANSSGWTDAADSAGIIGSVMTQGASSQTVVVSAYPQQGTGFFPTNQCLAPRNYTLLPADSYSDSAFFRLYITDAEFLTMINDTTCPSCTRAEDAYSLGITKYDDPANTALLNGFLIDDSGN